jgi:hypothetical protein
MDKKHALIIPLVFLFFLLLGSFFLIKRKNQSGELLFNTAQESSFLGFAKGISSVSKPRGGGTVLPDLPREMIKKAEDIVEKQVENPVRAEYVFTSSTSDYDSPFSFLLVLYAAPDPFRWRFDFVMDDIEEGDRYVNIYTYDGINYRTCDLGVGRCTVAPDNFIEGYLTTPLNLTYLLNDFLEPISFKKLVPNTKESRKASFEEYTETIIGYLGNCQIADDEYSIIEYCLNEEKDILLFLDLKTKWPSGGILRHQTLTLQDIEFSDLSGEVFTSPSLDF